MKTISVIDRLPLKTKDWTENNFFQRLEGDGGVLFDMALNEFGDCKYKFPNIAEWVLPTKYYFIYIAINNECFAIEVFNTSCSKHSSFRGPKFFKSKEVLQFNKITDFILRLLKEENIDIYED